MKKSKIYEQKMIRPLKLINRIVIQKRKQNPRSLKKNIETFFQNGGLNYIKNIKSFILNCNLPQKMLVQQNLIRPKFNPIDEQTHVRDKASKSSNSDPLNLHAFVSLCHYIISKYEKSDIKSISIQKSAISQVLNCYVKAQNMPCLIYEHLSETFCSLYEAYMDKDFELVKRQIEEIRETIESFNKQRQYGDYQSFNHLQIDENMTDTVLKQKFYNKVSMLMQEYKKFGDTSNLKVGKTKNSQNKKQQIIKSIKERQQRLLARQNEKVKPILAKITAKAKKTTEEQNKKQKEIEDREFVIHMAIKKAME